MLTYKEAYILLCVKHNANLDEVRPYLVDLCHAGLVYQDNGYKLTHQGEMACSLNTVAAISINETRLIRERGDAVNTAVIVLAAVTLGFTLLGKFTPWMLIPYLASLIGMLAYFHLKFKQSQKYLRKYFRVWLHGFEKTLADAAKADRSG